MNKRKSHPYSRQNPNNKQAQKRYYSHKTKTECYKFSFKGAP